MKEMKRFKKSLAQKQTHKQSTFIIKPVEINGINREQFF